MECAQMLSVRKQSQRRRGQAARAALSAQQREDSSAALCQRLLALPVFVRAQRVMLYAAHGAEVNLEALTRLAPEKQYCYPVCLPERQMAAACPVNEESWETGAYGIRAPVLARSQVLEPESLDLVLVPCTAFDDHCRRVGMGGGYYDRFLPRCKTAVSVGVAFSCQRVERAEVDQFDWTLDLFVTEQEIFVRKKEKIDE